MLLWILPFISNHSSKNGLGSLLFSTLWILATLHFSEWGILCFVRFDGVFHVPCAF